jgi:predicted phage-related endonuclease
MVGDEHTSAQVLNPSPPFIGGTSAAALAGVNPPNWSQPIDVWLELTGQAPPKVQTRMMAMGHLMEQLVADLFTEATGFTLRKPAARPERTCSYLHPEGGCTATLSREYPWAGAHLDRWSSDGASFEAKWAMGKDEWGPGLGSGTLEAPVIIPARDDPEYRPRVPLRYAVQVQHGLAVTGRELGYLAVLLGYGDFRWYALWRDDAMIANLMELEERFMRENVAAGVPPSPDGTEAYGRHLRRRFDSDDGSEAVATPEQQALVRHLRVARHLREGAERDEAMAAQLVQTSMGSTAKLIGPGFSVSWRKGKPRLSVEWEPLATELLHRWHELRRQTGDEPTEWPTTKKAQAELVRAIARGLQLAKEEEGTRPFKPTFDEEEAEQ